MKTTYSTENWTPQNNAEILFETADKCKAKGIIESIKVPLWRDTSCLNLRIKLKWWDFGYVLYWAWDNSICNTPLLYNLSGKNLPNVWDEFYAIWTYSWVDILKIWEEVYNENLELPNCLSWYNPEEETRDIYDNANKCQISWKIYNITKTLNNPTCPFNDLNIIINKWEGLYQVQATEDIDMGCIIDKTFPIHNNRWDSYYPKIWDKFSAVLDMNSNYSILKYGEEFLNDSIPICTGNFLSEVKEEPKEIPTTKTKKEQIPVIKENSINNTSPKVTPPPVIVDEKVTEVLSHTWIQNIENSWTLSTTNIEVNSWNLSQSQIENHENIKEVEITSNTETINIIEKSTQKIDSSFYIIWWIIFIMIVIIFFALKLYKNKFIKK